jgi:acyl-CoA synthetase (AMP-forming)/AMP-acid ligase II
MSFLEIIQKRAKETPDKLALIFRSQPISFGALLAKSFCLANNLRRLGVKRGDRVAIFLPNWPQYLYSYVAIWCCGATAVPLDFMLTEDEIISCVSHSETKVLIAQSKVSVSLHRLKDACPPLKEIIACEENAKPFLSFEELSEKGSALFSGVAVQDKDYAIIFYTSGTTGKPKGVLVNYAQLNAPPKAMVYFVDVKESDTSICALPFSHLGGLIYIQTSITYGHAFVLMERFIPLEFLKNAEAHKVNWFWLVPSMYYALLHLKEFESFELSNLRWIVSFGASSSPDALRRFHQYCPQAHFLNGWGMTETNAPTVVLRRGSEKIESIGRPAPWIEIKIFDDEDREMKRGGIGEIVVKSWTVTDGYYKDPELTREAMRGGWFHTGDLGRIDSDGDLYIVGRKKEMIKVAGEIVFEPEIEAALQKNPAVAEVAVVGTPDNLRGEVPKAFIAVKEGISVTEEGLRQFCRQHLAHFKIPHYFEFMPSLPKNRTGKIDKEKLRNPVI